MQLRLALLMALLSLAACQTPAPAPTGGSLPGSAQSLLNWNLKGRLGYRAGDDGGSASLERRQRDVQGLINFSGPMGFGSAEIRWNPDQAMLDTGKEQLIADDTASLAWRLTGLWLPVEALEYWVRGLPFPRAAYQADHNDSGALAALQQLGWALEFERYSAVPGGASLPHKIRATREDQRFTLLVQDWEPLP